MKKVSGFVVGIFAFWFAAMILHGANADVGQNFTSTPMQLAQLPPPQGNPEGLGPGGPEGRGQLSPGELSKMREQMLGRLLDQAGLTAKERSAVKKALAAKDEARRVLSEQLNRLRRIANKSKPTSKELTEALAAYRTAIAKYREKVVSQDRFLVKQLSLPAQVRCMSLGVLDNGIGQVGPGAGPAGVPRGEFGGNSARPGNGGTPPHGFEPPR
jgi:hypothetical protein